MNIKLRPHHLLCTQGYAGKGYDDAFVENMTAIVNHLRGERNVIVEIICSTDDICARCPEMLGPDRCRENEKVKEFDRKVCQYFDLSEGMYVYQEVVRDIRAKMTAAMMEDICGGCSWYPVSACRRNILSAEG